jgi:PHD/YefM family antitoxin component YafN of YafNO toxin-antitoxin module
MNKPLKSVPAATMRRVFNAKLAEMANNKAEGFLIQKCNQPAAVLIRAQMFETLRDQIDDLRADLLAAERQRHLDEASTVSLEAMEARFNCPERSQ